MSWTPPCHWRRRREISPWEWLPADRIFSPSLVLPVFPGLSPFSALFSRERPFARTPFLRESDWSPPTPQEGGGCGQAEEIS